MIVGPRGRRARRPAEAAERLERLRQRNADQLVAQRDAERRIETALKAYVDADVSTSAVERDRDEKVAALERQIEHVRAAARVKVEQAGAQQAVGVWQLNARAARWSRSRSYWSCPRRKHGGCCPPGARLRSRIPSLLQTRAAHRRKALPQPTGNSLPSSNRRRSQRGRRR